MSLREWLPFLSCCAVIFGVTSGFIDETPMVAPLYDGVADRVSAVSETTGRLAVEALNVLAHVVPFLLLGLATFPLLQSKSGKKPDPRFALFLCGGVALGSEVCQFLVPAHTPEVFDVAVNLAGSLTGITAAGMFSAARGPAAQSPPIADWGSDGVIMK